MPRSVGSALLSPPAAAAKQRSTPIISIKSLPRPDLQVGTPGKQPAVFLDRDGVINTTNGFVNTPEDLDRQLIPRSVQALAKMSRETPVKLVIVTNQGGVGEGKMTDEVAHAILQRLADRVAELGGHLEAIYYAPNGLKDVTPAGEVSARKPEGGLLLKAAADLGTQVDLADSFMVGDMVTDFMAGKSASQSVTTVGVRTGFNSRDLKNPAAMKPDVLFDDLMAFADWFTAKYGGGMPALGQAELVKSAREFKSDAASVLTLIDRAQARLWLEVDSLDDDTTDRLLQAVQRGADVRVVLSPGRRLDPFEVQRVLALTDSGVDLKVTTAPKPPTRSGLSDGVAFTADSPDPIVQERPPKIDEDLGHIDALARRLDAALSDPVVGGGELLPPGQVKVHTFPEENAGLINQKIAAAKTSIDLEVYQLTDRSVIAALLAAAKRGVKVRVMVEPKALEPSNFPYLSKQLAAAGIEMKATPKAFDSNMNVDHAKFMVIDAKELLFGSGNLVRVGLGGNARPEANTRDFWVEDTRDATVREGAGLFEADWAENQTSAADFPILTVTPDDAQEDLKLLCAQATKRLWVTNQSLSEPAMVQNLLEAKKRGVDVKVLLGAFQRDEHTPPSNDAALQQLKAAGVDVQYFTSSYLHAKTILADDRAFIGSQNFTAGGLVRNRDLGCVYDDGELVKTVAQTFTKDWADPGPQPTVR